MLEAHWHTMRDLILIACIPLVVYVGIVALLHFSRLANPRPTNPSRAETTPIAHQPLPPPDQAVQQKSFCEIQPRPKLEVIEGTTNKAQKPAKVDPDYHCTTCSLLFQSQEALENRFTYSKCRNWCLRCKRHFVSPAAIYEHRQKSQRHWICDYHNFDFPTKSALKEHCARFFNSITAREKQYEKSHSHWTFKTHDLDYPRCKELYQHYASDPSHFRCPSCSKHCDTSVQLRDYLISHLPRNIDCWGCPKKFIRYAPLLGHLETGTCVTTRLQLDRLAVQREFSSDYVSPGCEEYLRRGLRQEHGARPVFLSQPRRFGCSKCDKIFDHYAGMMAHVQSSFQDPLLYQCAGCEAKFADLSGLLQHVESNTCAEGINYGTGSIGKLLHHLWEVLA